MLRRLKTEVLTAMPKKTRYRVMVKLDAFDQANYKKAERDVVAWLREVASDERARSASRGQAVVKLTMLRRIAAVGKLRHAVRDYLTAWFARHHRPLVIFGFHKQVLRGAYSICESLGLRVSSIQGKDSAKKRQEEVDRFSCGAADVFLAPIRSAGIGLNLQVSSDVLFLERVWTPALMLQAEDRVYRIGQERDVTVTYLDAQGTVDEYLAQVLTSKQRLIDRVVDGRRFNRAHVMSDIDEVISSFASGA
jgi:SWI/SNF-related matrix-associated actin-dependent regulator 1 of chromatin subfamily A